MRAILIDSTKKEITEVNVSKSGTLQDWYSLIGCEIVEVGHYINNKDSILVDEEGMMGKPTSFFSYKGARHPYFAGNGLIVGVDENGESVSCSLVASDVVKMVSFHNEI